MAVDQISVVGNTMTRANVDSVILERKESSASLQLVLH
jgi:hypothetical protein